MLTACCSGTVAGYPISRAFWQKDCALHHQQPRQLDICQPQISHIVTWLGLLLQPPLTPHTLELCACSPSVFLAVRSSTRA